MKNFIIESAIPAFRNFLVTDRVALSIIENDDTITWESLMLDSSFKPKKILTVPSNKFEFDNCMSIVHYLSPASTVAGLNLCRMASEECKKACLGFTGNLNFHVNKSYRDKTIALVKFTKRYLQALVAEIVRYTMIAISQGKKPYFRLNGLSDIPFYRVIDFVALDAWIKETAAQLGVIFDGPTLYDYSKYPVNQGIEGVYHVTYSYNENTRLEWLTRFDRIAFVLSKKDHKKLLSLYPDIFIDGNSSDIRPLDNVKYVLLPLKGKNEGETGFVLNGNTVLSIVDIEGVENV